MSSMQDENYGSIQVDRNQNDLNRVSRSEHVENVNPPADQQSTPEPPDVEQYEVTHYAYDPQTYEILCRPGQRLSQKKAQRLQKLNLYAYVVRLGKT